MTAVRLNYAATPVKYANKSSACVHDRLTHCFQHLGKICDSGTAGRVVLGFLDGSLR